jgi:hypothetical protein
VRLERYGKSSIALARCNASENGPAPDQSAYEPLFQTASEALTSYRRLLGVKHTVPAELTQIPPSSEHAAKDKNPKTVKNKR